MFGLEEELYDEIRALKAKIELMEAQTSLPSDVESEKWFNENISEGCSASSGIYKFRLWLKEREKLNKKL